MTSTGEITRAKAASIFEKPRSYLGNIYLFKKPAKRSLNENVKTWATRAIALAFWLYVPLKLFVFDIDSFVLSLLAPGYEWIIGYKLVASLCIVSLIWVWFGTRDYLVLALYVAMYPLRFILIIIPKYILLIMIRSRSWLFALALSNALIALLKGLKFNFAFLTAFVVAALISLVSKNPISLYASVAALFAMLMLTFARSILSSISQTGVFRFYASMFRGQNEARHKPFLLEDNLRGRSLENLEPDQQKQWNNGLEKTLAYNRMCLFLARTLRDYQRSPWQFMPAVFGIIRLGLFNALCFMLINNALFKTDRTLYTYTHVPKLFTFAYFSFSALLFNSIDELKASQAFSQSVYMSQEFLSFILIVISVTIVFSQRAQHISSDLDEAIANAEREASSIEGLIRSEYRMATIQVAMEHLKDAESSLVKFIYWLSKGI